MTKWKVYISSTFKDLKEFRADLINLFQNQLKNNFELSEIMERMFDDGTYTPYVQDCVDAVNESDIYIIILGNRVGSFPPGEERTYTEIELDTALEAGKKIFCLRLKDFDEAAIDNKAKHDAILAKFRGRPIHRFKDTKDLKSALYEFLIQFTSETPVNTKNPYKGLASFDVDDGGYFFGRDAELEACLKKISTAEGNFFVSVIGNSGTGKSSFVKAGLMYRLKTNAQYGYTNRKQVLVTPGDEPYTNLKYQLQLQGVSIDEILNPNPKTPDLVLFFDQFEEVITQCHSPEALEERDSLFEFLNTLATKKKADSKILVLCTYRSDFLSQLANFEFIKAHQFLFPISSLDYKVHADNWEESITAIITNPALKNGVVIENELVEQVLEQIKEVDGSLPILQFTLERIWNKETIEDRSISSTEFNKLSEGKGISGIIETHAEKVIKEITNNGQDKEKETILKTIFVNLVEVNENRNDIKRTVSKEELYSILRQYPEKAVNTVFEAMVSERSRLLNVRQEKDETIRVGIIHEELIRKWDRLRGWVDERREALETKKRIALEVSAYQKGEESLYNRSQLKRAQSWSQENPDLVDAEIAAFMAASQKRNARKLRNQVGITTLVVALITAVIFKWVQPAIQKADTAGLIEDNHPVLWYSIKAAGGMNKVEELYIDNVNYSTLNGNLKFFGNLKTITLDNIDALKDLSIFINLKNPANLDTLIILNNPILANVSELKVLDGLISLSISGNNRLSDLDGIEDLSTLESLMISGVNFHSLKGIDSLQALTDLGLNGTFTDLSRLKSLRSLNSLLIMQNSDFHDLEEIQELTGLTSLEISANKSLTSLKGIEKLSSLTNLVISDNPFLSNLNGIETLKSLETLDLALNMNLTNISAIKWLPVLTSVSISYNNELSDLNGLESLKSLKSLELFGNFSDLNLVGDFKELTDLTIAGNVHFVDLAAIKKLRNLISLDISYNANLRSIRDLSAFLNLKSLEIYGNRTLTDLEGIETLEALKSLRISDNPHLTDLSDISALNSLKSLILSGNDNLTTLNGIEPMKSLNSLIISDNQNLADLSGINELRSLTNLEISKCDKLTNLDLFDRLNSVTILKIEKNVNLTDLQGIKAFPALTLLEILDNDRLADLNGLNELNALTSLVISDNPRLKDMIRINDKICQLPNLKELTIDRNLDLDFETLKNTNPQLTIRIIQ